MTEMLCITKGKCNFYKPKEKYDEQFSEKEKSSTEKSIDYYTLKNKLIAEDPESFREREAEIRELNKELEERRF